MTEPARADAHELVVVDRPDAISIAFAAAVRALVAALPPETAEANIAVAHLLEACARTRSALRSACGPLH
jgi:hypothetical protein